MGIKSFFMKKAFQMKGMSADQAEKLAAEFDKNPELVASLKKMEENKELKALFENIQKEIELHKKAGMQEQFASVLVMGKYKAEITKYRDELMPLMQLMQKQ